MIDVKKLLCEICDDDMVYEEGIDLYESGLLDSLTFIDLFSRLEDEGILLYPTRIDRERLRTVEGIEQLIRDYYDGKLDPKDP